MIINKFYTTLYVIIFTSSIISAQTLLRDNIAPSTVANSIAFLDGSSSPGYNSVGANYAGKGIIFPSMDLTLALNGAPFDQGLVGGAGYNPNFYDGLVIYNTGIGAVAMGTSAEDVAPGFYYYDNSARVAWDGGTWTPMGGGGGAAAAPLAIPDDTPMDSDLVIGTTPERIVRLSGTADGVSTHIDLGTTVLGANTVSTFRKAIIYDGTTGHVILEASGSYDSTTNVFVTGNSMMNVLLPAGTYTVEVYYTE